MTSRARAGFCTAITAVALLVTGVGATATAAAEASPPSTSGESAPDVRSEVRAGAEAQASVSAARASATASSETITFSEFAMGSAISTQYVQRGIRFSGDSPFITTDGASPTSPVLSGTPTFQGAIEGWFVNPDGTARTVSSLRLDVGYIDTPHSTAVNVYGPDGTLLLSVDLAAGGIVDTTINQVGMAWFRVESISDEPAGFAIDNVSFPTPGPIGGVADTYVALGDSFQSGQGADNYLPGTDEGSGNGCRRSDDAYPRVLEDIGTVDLTLDFRACSGATISTLINGMNGEESQLTALDSRTRLVTVGIVGNDLEFGPTIGGCVLTSGGSGWKPWEWYRSCESNQGDQVDDKIQSLTSGDLQDKLYSLYRDIRLRAPNARVLVINYPKFFPEQGADGWNGCQWIRVSDQKWINSNILRANNIITRTAMKAGFESIDMSDVLDGHEECTDVPAINGVPITDRNASFHPNSLGHLYMALRIDDHLGMGIVHPSFTIHQGEIVRGTYTIEGSAFTLNTSWPGSDVITTLISPSGVRYTREAPLDAEHANGPTWEYFSVPNPEPGQWTVEHYGADVAADGEPVTVSTLDETPLNQPPTAVIAIERSGSTATFDASGSTDADGTITDYLWDFGDGTTAAGTRVTHQFAPGTYDVALVASDEAGERGFSSVPVAVATDPSAVAVYSGSSLTATNSLALEGPGTDLLVNGDFTCNSDVHIGGNVTVTGKVYLTSRCRIDGTLWAAGPVRADARAEVGGAVRAGGPITIQSTVQVGGYLATHAGVVVSDGTSIEQLQAAGAIGGEVYPGETDMPLPATPVTVAADVTAPPRAASVSWAGWMRSIAQGAEAPAWSPALSANPGCTMAKWSVATTSVTVPGDTYVDARATASGCPTVSLQGLTLELSGDLTLVVDSFASANGLTVTVADGRAHRLRLLSAAGASSTMRLVGPTSVDRLVDVEVVSAGTVQIDGRTDLTGTISAGRIRTSGAVTVHGPAVS